MGNRRIRGYFDSHHSIPGISDLRKTFCRAVGLVSGKAWFLAWGMRTGLMLGGAHRLKDYALKHTREKNSHAVADLGALQANGWQLRSLLKIAGDEIDADFKNVKRLKCAPSA
jgi:hypothetical protein